MLWPPDMKYCPSGVLSGKSLGACDGMGQFARQGSAASQGTFVQFPVLVDGGDPAPGFAAGWIFSENTDQFLGSFNRGRVIGYVVNKSYKIG